jgi:hypothetical protein
VTAREGNTIHLKTGGLLMAEETYEQFKQWLAEHAAENFRKRLDEAPAPGMRPDRTIEFLRPGQPKPQPRIIKRFPANEEDDI